MELLIGALAVLSLLDLVDEIPQIAIAGWVRLLLSLLLGILIAFFLLSSSVIVGIAISGLAGILRQFALGLVSFRLQSVGRRR